MTSTTSSPASRTGAAVIVETKPEVLEEVAKRLRERKIEVSIVRLIQHGDRKPLGLSTDAVARFATGLDRQVIDQLAAKYGFDVVREVRHAGNAFLLRRPGAADYDVLSAIDALGMEQGVVYVQADFVVFLERHQYIPNDPLGRTFRTFSSYGATAHGIGSVTSPCPCAAVRQR